MTDLIQYPDINASKKSYSHLKKDQLLVANLWSTIQGEGIYAGVPATFLRLSGCNKGDKRSSCRFCDTDFRLSKGIIYSISDIIAQVEKNKAELIVITGGEPMIQPNLVPLIEALNKIGKVVQIESNGDRLADGYKKRLATLVVSPKVNPSTQTYKEPQKKVLVAVDYLKFVVDAREDSPYHNIPIWAHHRNPSTIYISPIAVYKRTVREGEVANAWDDTLIDRELTSKNYKHAYKLCLENGWNLSIQSHLFVGAP